MTPPNIPIPDGYNFRDVQLELSLKPFFDNTPATREAVCREIFFQWHAMTRHAESISIMLLIAEGSEILEYDGNEDTEFEWARYHGAPNRHIWSLPTKKGKTKPDHEGLGTYVGDNDPDGLGIHSRAYLYRPEPATFTYGWLRGLVTDLKRIGHEMTGKTILVGNFFDIGPEFAISKFKYTWHREILGDGPIFKEQFVSCEAVLKGDDRCYAGFPNGIPDGTPIGTFLGRQLNTLFENCGLDFLWLSNGFGFSLEPWAMVGEVFDGVGYRTERSEAIQDRVLKFWKDLRADFPNKYHLRSRGTNMATGIDLGSDASPLKGIYEGDFAVDAPVNSPWAALDGDFGLELSGWMSHIAQHPGDTFRFRFYLHDPWWLNSPWLDRYARQPHDIFLPLSVSRLQANGQVEIPRDISFLSIDDSHGNMPLSVPNESTAHILRARETAPDAPGPLLWAYPFDDFHHLAVAGKRPDLTLHADAYIGTIINEGVPLNTVVDMGELAEAWQALPASKQGSIILSPVPQAGTQSEALLMAKHQAGVDIVLYGPVPEASAFCDVLGLSLAEPVEGDFTLLPSDLEDFNHVATTLRHTAIISGGGWAEVLATDVSKNDYKALEGEQGTNKRVATIVVKPKASGRIAWTRASLSTAEYDPEEPTPIRGPILQPLARDIYYPYGRLIRTALRELDWFIDHTPSDYSQRAPYLTAHRHKNAYILSGHHRDENTLQHIRLPLGAPLLMGRHNRVIDGVTQVTGQTAWQNEVRVFVEDGADGTYYAQEPPPLMHGVNRRLLIHGCKGATLVFLVDPSLTKNIRILHDPRFPYFVGEFVEPKIETTAHGDIIKVKAIDDCILFEW